MIPVLYAAAASGADCEGSGRLANVDRAIGQAEIALQSLDFVALEAALGAAQRDVACLYEPFGTHHVARWFRVTGIHAFVSGDPEAARDLLSAARSLEPAFVLDPALGAPIQEAYAQAVPPRGEGFPLAPPSEGWVVVDGRPSDLAPPGRTFVVQWFGDDGAVRMTRRVAPGAPPPYPLGAPRPVVVVPLPAPLPVPLPPVVAERRRSPSRALALGGLGTGLVAGAGIAIASSLKHEILTAPTVSDTLVNTNRAVGYTAGALGVGALGLGISAVVVGRW